MVVPGARDMNIYAVPAEVTIPKGRGAGIPAPCCARYSILLYSVKSSSCGTILATIVGLHLTTAWPLQAVDCQINSLAAIALLRLVDRASLFLSWYCTSRRPCTASDSGKTTVAAPIQDANSLVLDCYVASCSTALPALRKASVSLHSNKVRRFRSRDCSTYFASFSGAHYILWGAETTDLLLGWLSTLFAAFEEPSH